MLKSECVPHFSTLLFTPYFRFWYFHSPLDSGDSEPSVCSRFLQVLLPVKFNNDNAVVVLCPKKIGAIDVTKMPLSSLQQPTYAERLFIDLWKIHQSDHCKGVMFFYRVQDKHDNMTRDVCKLFTDVCPHCICVISRRRLTAGIQPIITFGTCVRGQTNIIHFQSMPDGPFKFLLNYIDIMESRN